MEEELKKVFLELVQFGKTVSPEIWKILITQQIVWAISSVLSMILTIPVALFTYLKWIDTKDRDNNFDINPYGVATTIIAFLSLISIVIFLSEGLPRLVNPEYYALIALKP